MELQSVFDIKTIKTKLNAGSKDEAIQELSKELLSNGYITDLDGFINDIYLREKEGKTGIGNFIAIPHGKSAFVDRIGVAIGISDKEIPWESLDGKGVKGIILFAVGDDNEGANSHLKLLSLFARKLGNDEVINNFLQSSSPQEVIQAFR